MKLKNLFLLLISSIALAIPSVTLAVLRQNPDPNFFVDAPGHDFRSIMLYAINNVILPITGLVSIGFLMYGGFTYMTAGGDDKRVASAKKIIFNSLIGFALILLSYAILSIINNAVSTGTY